MGFRPIEKCFDKSNHDWLLENTPMARKVLKSWLKAGYIKSSELFPTEEGTGGVISSTLANFTLNGLVNYLEKRFKPGHTRSSKKQKPNLFRATRLNKHYADDIFVTRQSKRQHEGVKTAVSEFLRIRKLKLSEEKTQIHAFFQGLDFLGWTFRRQPTFLSKISKKSLDRHHKEIKYLTKTIFSPEALITKINAKTREKMNYHHCWKDIWKVRATLNKYTYER